MVCDHASLAEVQHDPALLALWDDDPDALVELRLDGYADLCADTLRTTLMHLGPGRCLLTFRSLDEGGFGIAPAHDAARVALLAVGQACGVYAVDVELASLTRHTDLRTMWQQGPALRVASVHRLDDVPDVATLQALRQAAEDLGADVIKIVVTPDDVLASEPVLALLESAHDTHPPLVALAQGPAGTWTRLLARRFAARTPWTYVRRAKSRTPALGHLSWDEARRLYRVRQVGPRTPIFGVIGAPVAHSASPRLHNGWLAEAGADGIYLPLHLGDSLDVFLRLMAQRLGIVGLSVTHPLKQAAYQSADTHTPIAASTGVANTLWRQAQDSTAWCADNTDVAAAQQTLQALAEGSLAGRIVIVLGAGGAARAVVYAAARAGAQVYIWARRPHAAQSLAQELGAMHLTDQVLTDRAFGPALVVNCTPAGMAPAIDVMPIAPQGFAPATCFFDTIYAPERTAWLKAAEAQGHRTQNGMPMLVQQARAQFARFIGRATA